MNAIFSCRYSCVQNKCSQMHRLFVMKNRVKHSPLSFFSVAEPWGPIKCSSPGLQPSICAFISPMDNLTSSLGTSLTVSCSWFIEHIFDHCFGIFTCLIYSNDGDLFKIWLQSCVNSRTTFHLNSAFSTSLFTINSMSKICWSSCPGIQGNLVFTH